MLVTPDRKGTKSKQGAGHVWVLADEARDEASVSIVLRKLGRAGRCKETIS
jgi:hypothetical protein